MRNYNYQILEQDRSAKRSPLGLLTSAILLAVIFFVTAPLFAEFNQGDNSLPEVRDAMLPEAPEPRSSTLPGPFESGAGIAKLSDRTLEPASPDAGVKAKPKAKQITTTTTGTWKTRKIRKGDSLSKVFDDLNLGQTLLHNLLASSDEAKKLTRIKPGAELRFHWGDDGEFDRLTYVISPVSSLVIRKTEDGGFESEQVDRDVEHRVKTVTGTIENSLFVAAQKAGLSDALTMELAGIFAWDVDFALEIRPGDHFSVIYREDWLDGNKLQNGPILAAEFVNQGHTYRALRYEDGDGRTGYYTPEGSSLRKAFLRTPVKFSRISSGFSKKRWHPLLKKWRSHKGVDYAAPTGTPVKAAGDGKIAFRGTKGGYGKVLFIQHAGKYTTVYGHLSKFAKNVKAGSRVKQGQVIGYVGQTGMASGPHLHFEFRVNGEHRNPLKVKLPAAAPIAKKYRSDFRSKTASLLSQLDTLSETMVAQLQ